MPPLPMPLDPPDKVFGLAAPHHMLMKLKWEIFQLRTVAAEPCEPGAEIEPGYHAFNCVVTAWHMADWVWQSASPQDRAELLSKLNIVATGALIPPSCRTARRCTTRGARPPSGPRPRRCP